MEGEIVIKRWEDLDGEVSSYRLCCLLRLTSTLIRLLTYAPRGVRGVPGGPKGRCNRGINVGKCKAQPPINTQH